MKQATERDFRMPEFRDANPDDYEIRADGRPVRKDRWENGIRQIVGILGWSRQDFEVPDVVKRVEEIVAKLQATRTIQPDGTCSVCENETNRGHCACPCTDDECDFCG